MSQIKGKNTKPENIVCRYLFSQGFRYRKNDRRYPGTPDIVLPKYRTVIFVNGCFWHGHGNCRFFVVPKTNTDFWLDKIRKNIDRDKRDIALLEQDGWRVITIWECELRKENVENTLEMLINMLKDAVH